MVRSSYSRGAVMVLSRYAPDSLLVRHIQGSFTPAILAQTCLKPSTCTIRPIVRSTVAVWSGTALGMLSVRSWYGTLKVRSRLVFSTNLEPGTCIVRSIVRVAQSWRGLAGFDSAGLDRDNKLSLS